ncbi:MAG TPA: OmpH family outer membrane protein [Pyrinomonadaceae bacterium]|nr:OmpH family outer membrane protein [Pyrinomonadaceae bacterium]
MKHVTVLTLTMFFAFAFAASALAQAPAGGKIAVIDTLVFRDEKAGITKYVNALKSVNAEFAPVQAELQALGTRIQNLDKEMTAMREAQQKGMPVDARAFETKRDEYDRLLRDLKFKEEDAKARYERRISIMSEPLNQAIGTALNEYGKQKGYAIILDVSRDTAGLIVAIPDEKIDITKDFITFYNAKP